MPRQEVEDLVGAAADEVESVEGEGWPGTVSGEAFEANAVGGFNADAGIEAEPAYVIPGEHVLGVVELQEAMAGKVAKYPLADRVLEFGWELGCESCRFVEKETGMRILVPIIWELLEEAIDDDTVEVRIKRGAEAVQKADGPEGGIGWGCGTGLTEGGPKGPETDMEDGRGGRGL